MRNWLLECAAGSASALPRHCETLAFLAEEEENLARGLANLNLRSAPLPQRAPDQQGARVPAMSRQRKQVVARSALDTVSYLPLQHCTTFGTGAWSMVTALDTLRRGTSHCSASLSYARKPGTPSPARPS